jgi:hypothetical protein
MPVLGILAQPPSSVSQATANKMEPLSIAAAVIAIALESNGKQWPGPVIPFL